MWIFTILLIEAAYILSEILSVTLAAMLHCPRIYMAMDRIMIETLLQAILQQVEQPKRIWNTICVPCSMKPLARWI